MAKTLSSQRGSPFRQNFLRVFKANLIAQVIALVAAPLLTRLYTPTEYGTAAIFALVLSLLAPVATWKMDWSTPNATTRTQAAATLVLGGAVLILLCLFLAMAGVFLPHSFDIIPSLRQIQTFWFLLPLALIGTGVHALLTGWYIRENNLSTVARTKITQSLGGTAFNLSAGLAGLGAQGLIISSVLSAWLGMGVMIRHARYLRSSLARLTERRIIQAFIRFRREAAHSLLASSLNTVALTIAPMLLSIYYSAAEFGQYALMNRLALLPSGLLASAIGQSFWSEAAKLVKKDRAELRRLYLKTTRRLAGLAAAASVLCLGGPLYVETIFGSQWEGAGWILAAMAPWVFGQFVVSPLSHLIVHRKQHWQVVWDICRLLLLVAVIAYCATFELSMTMAVLATSVVMLIMYCLLFAMNLANLGNRVTS